MTNEQNRSIDLSVKLELSDFYSFRKEIYNNNKGNKLLRIMSMSFLILFLITLVSFASYIPNTNVNILERLSQPEALSALLKTLGLFSAIVLIPLVVLPLLNSYFSKKYFNSNKLLQNEQKYNFTDEGISISSENGNGKIDWDKIFKVDESKTFFALYISIGQAYIIPKRFFNSDDDIKLFKEILKDNIDNKKLKMKK